MWTAIWTVLGFVLALAVLLFLGEPILAFVAEQLRERRAHRLALERERTKQATLAHQRDALVWRELEHPTSSDPASGTAKPAHRPRPSKSAPAERLSRLPGTARDPAQR